MAVNTLPWSYSPVLGNLSETVILAGDEWHHLHHVLRMQEGQSLALFDGKGRCLEGFIQHAAKAEGHVELIRDCSDDFDVHRHFRLTVAIAPTKQAERIEFAIEKLVELGVDVIAFLDCAHGERSHLRYDRFEKIAISAAKQSRKLYLPHWIELIPPLVYAEQCILQGSILESSVANTGIPPRPFDLFCCHLDREPSPLFANYSHSRDVVVMIGPEGGFSEGEIEGLKLLGARMVTLGPHRLRVETAAITACAQVHLMHEMNSTT